MESNKPKIEDILEKPTGIEKLSELDGFDKPVFKAMVNFISACHRAKSRKYTTRLMIAWDELEKGEKALLTEHYSKLQLSVLGLSIIASEFVGSGSVMAIPFPGGLSKLFSGSTGSGENPLADLFKNFEKMMEDNEEGK